MYFGGEEVGKVNHTVKVKKGLAEGFTD